MNQELDKIVERAGKSAGNAVEAVAAKIIRVLGPWLAQLDRLVARTIEASRARAHAFFAKLRKEGRIRAEVTGRGVEAVVATWLFFALGASAPDVAAKLACPFLWFFYPLFGAPACVRGSWDPVGLTALLFALAMFAVFHFVARWLIAIASDIAESRATIVPSDQVRAKALIMGLSPLPNGMTAQDAMAEAATNARDWKAYTAPIAVGVTSRLTWQQNARAIAHHLSELRVVYMLPSKETIDNFDDFRAFCCTLFGRDLDIRRVTDEQGEAWRDRNVGAEHERSYENYNYIYGGMSRAIGQIKEAFHDISDRDICIDVTAGQKIFSIAGGVITLNRKMYFGYVTTGAAGVNIGGDVRIYDAQLSSLGSLAGAAQRGG